MPIFKYFLAAEYVIKGTSKKWALEKLVFQKCELLGVPAGTITRKSQKLWLFRGALKAINISYKQKKYQQVIKTNYSNLHQDSSNNHFKPILNFAYELKHIFYREEKSIYYEFINSRSTYNYRSTFYRCCEILI